MVTRLVVEHGQLQGLATSLGGHVKCVGWFIADGCEWTYLYSVGQNVTFS